MLFWLWLKRFFLFSLVWLVISAGRIELAWTGLVAAALTSAVTLFIWRRQGKRPRLFRVLVYFPGFVWRSIQGGADVTWRVFHPHMPIHPGFLRYRTRDADESARVMLCDSLSLMPGTLAVDLQGRETEVHLLSINQHAREQITEEELRVSQLFEDTKYRNTGD